MIELKNLHAKAGNFQLEDINLRIESGEYFVLLGPTGAGKTFLIECICGLRRVECGEVFINHRNVTHLEPADRHVGYVPQDYALFPTMTVYDNIAFGLKARRSSRIRTKVLEMADMLRISHLLERYPQSLSSGERQRVAVARALITEPDVLLLDEPLSALDPSTTESLCRELKRVQNQMRTTTVHVCHNFEEMLMVADRTGILNAGKLVQVGKPEEIFRRPKTEFVARFVRSRNIFVGHATFQNGECRINLGELTISCQAEARGKVCFSIRPEEISISPVKPPDECGNILIGAIQRIELKGALTEIEVDVGVIIVSWMLTPAFARLNLDVGSQVYVHFEADAVNILQSDEREQGGEEL
ncbi:MAG TPA: ABC transporter ATP-binding protein [Armatimonadetes bacterium]|nr:ABC transporter ATP-binding protein [Armatimonadota bacterium]